MMHESLFLPGAGFLGGVINAVADGGSFITFPALFFVGVPPIQANASNTFASLAGYLSGAYAFRKEILACKKELFSLTAISLLGGALGALMLLKAPETIFRQAIPWLLLFATTLFISGEKINIFLKSHAANSKHAPRTGQFLLLIILLSICIYGGFFNAEPGIIAPSYFALKGHRDINTMNALKLLLSFFVSLTAVALFIHKGSIAWRQASIVLLGSLLGGYASAAVCRHIPQRHIKSAVIITSGIVTGCFLS